MGEWRRGGLAAGGGGEKWGGGRQADVGSFSFAGPGRASAGSREPLGNRTGGPLKLRRLMAGEEGFALGARGGFHGLGMLALARAAARSAVGVGKREAHGRDGRKAGGKLKMAAEVAEVRGRRTRQQAKWERRKWRKCGAPFFHLEWGAAIP